MGSDRGGWNSTHVLLAGFATIVLLLVYSTVQASWLQNAGWAEHEGAYQRYIRNDDAITELRRAVWLGEGYARDYLLNGGDEARGRFEAQIEKLQSDADEQMAALRELHGVKDGKLAAEAPFSEFLADLRALAEGQRIRGRSAASIVQDFVVPRRIATFGVLEEMRRTARQQLQAEQSTFQGERTTAARKLVFLLAVSILLGMTVAWISLRLAARWETERQRHYEALAEANLELENLSDRLLEIQEQERRTLSRELHDEVGQTLTALRMELSQALKGTREAGTRERLERARTLIEKTVHEVRDISLMLRPALLDDLGLGPALQWQVEEFAKRGNIRTEFHGADVGENLSDAVKTCVYRVAQEALNNCEKYSGAGRVRVLLAMEGDELSLEVSDDGAGFELDHRGMPMRGTGIFGMKERVQKLGGALSVESSPGRGTRLRLLLPAAVFAGEEALR